jgi:hypothetical protein
MKNAAIAYHEAGHAVVQHFLRLPIKRASIRPNDQSRGRVESIRYNKPMDLGTCRPLRKSDSIMRSSPVSLVRLLSAGPTRAACGSGMPNRITRRQ